MSQIHQFLKDHGYAFLIGGFHVKGQVIGFGGRVLESGEPKYLNSPETPLFSKGSELYGLSHGLYLAR